MALKLTNILSGHNFAQARLGCAFDKIQLFENGSIMLSNEQGEWMTTSKVQEVIIVTQNSQYTLTKAEEG